MDSASTAPHTKWQQTQSSSADRAISPDNRLNPDTDVMLRVECMSARSLKARLLSCLLILPADMPRLAVLLASSAPYSHRKCARQAPSHTRIHATTILTDSNVLQGLVFQGGVLRYLVFAVLVVFVVLEATHHVAEGHKRSVFIASTIIGGLCTALLATQGILLLRTLWQVHKLQKHW